MQLHKALLTFLPNVALNFRLGLGGFIIYMELQPTYLRGKVGFAI